MVLEIFLRQTWLGGTLSLVVISAVLLILTEILSPKYGKLNIRVDRTKLRALAFFTGILALLSLILLILS